MKKLTIIFSFILITVFSVGSYFLHQLYLKNYKKEFKSYIKTHKEQSAFSIITINPSELYANSANVIWEDEYKEVVYKGVLYDVVSVKGKGLTVELTVVSDHQEMKLKKEFASLYDVNTTEKTKGPFDLLKNFFALKFLLNHTEIDFLLHILDRATLSDNQLFLLVKIFIHQETPPPNPFLNCFNTN